MGVRAHDVGWVLLGAMFSGCCGAGSGVADGPPPSVVVITHCVGFDAGLMESSVTRPIEEQVIGVPSVSEVRSLSTDEASVVTAFVSPEADLYVVKSDLLARLSDAGTWLPESCEPPALGSGGAQGRVAVEVAMTGEWVLVDSAADELRRAWLAVPGVDEVRVCGMPRPQVHVALDTGRAAAHGVGPTDALASFADLRAAELPDFAPPGALTLDELGGLALGVPGEEAPRLRDLAVLAVERNFDCGRTWLDGAPVAVLTAIRAPGVVQDGEVDPILTTMEAWRAAAPPALRVSVLDAASLAVEVVVVDEALAHEQLAQIELAATAAGADQVRTDLAVPRSDALACDPSSGVGRIMVSWAGEPPVDARRELDRALQQIPGLAGHVAAPADMTLELRISATESGPLRETTDDVRERLLTVPDLLDAWALRPPDRPELVVRPDREHLAAFGLREADVIDAVRLATDGMVVGEVAIDGRWAPVVLSLGGGTGAADPLPTLASVDLIPRAGGSAIPLNAIARIEVTTRAAELHRVDLRPAASVFERVDPAGERLARERVLEAMAELALPEGVSVQLVD